MTFLRDVHDRLRRPIILVCDRLRVHRSAVRRLQESGADWLRVDWLPAYAPDLDPVENVWEQSKGGTLANFIPDDIAQLHNVLDQVLHTYRHQPNRMHSFFQAARLTE